MNELKAAVSVLVPTKNEERNIDECLRSVSWADEIIVFDSHSTDRTLEKATALGAQIVQRPFDNFADHKNWALDHLPFRNQWILILDADERIPPELAKEIAAKVAAPEAFAGYYIARQNWFCGKWIRHGGWYPNWNLRLLLRGRGRYEKRIVHEHVLLDGPAGFLKNPLVHYDFKGIERYFDRHNTYSSMEAVEMYRVMNHPAKVASLPALLIAKGPEKRRFLKQMAYRYLPARPVFKFLWMYLFQLGFLDGRMGFRYCMLHTFYEYQISLKLQELARPDTPMREKYNSHLD